MSAVEAKRTLVKSPPEVWAKVSDPEVLADHLADLGPVHITRVEPETVVHWEGDEATGSVHLEAGGWGTKVTLTVELPEAPPEPEVVAAPEPEPEPAPEPEPEPVVAAPPEPAPEPRRGFWARMFGRRKVVEPVVEPVAETPPPDPVPDIPPEPEPDPVPEPEPGEHPPSRADAGEALKVLEAALDRLGAAHHRPFSRA